MDSQRREQLEAQLSAYLDDELSPNQRAEVEAFLAGDADARKLLAELEATIAVMHDLPRARASDDLMEGIRARMEKQALLGELGHNGADTTTSSWNARPWAAAAIIALTATAGYFMWPADDAPPTNSEMRTLASKDKDQETFGEDDMRLGVRSEASKRDAAVPGSDVLTERIADGTELADARDRTDVHGKAGRLAGERRFTGDEELRSEHLASETEAKDGPASMGRAALHESNDAKTQLFESQYNELAIGGDNGVTADVAVTNGTTVGGTSERALRGASTEQAEGVSGKAPEMGDSIITWNVSEEVFAGALEGGEASESLVVDMGAGYGHFTREGAIDALGQIDAPEPIVLELAFHDAADRAQAMRLLDAMADSESVGSHESRLSKGGPARARPQNWYWRKPSSPGDRAVSERQPAAHEGEAEPAPETAASDAASPDVNKENVQTTDEDHAASAELWGQTLDASQPHDCSLSEINEAIVDTIPEEASPKSFVAADDGTDDLFSAQRSLIQGYDASGRTYRAAEVEAFVQNAKPSTVVLLDVSASGWKRSVARRRTQGRVVQDFDRQDEAPTRDAADAEESSSDKIQIGKVPEGRGYGGGGYGQRGRRRYDGYRRGWRFRRRRRCAG